MNRAHNLPSKRWSSSGKDTCPLFRQFGTNVLKEAEKVISIAWGSHKIEPPVIGLRFIVFGVNSEGADAGDVSGLQSAHHRILQ